MYTKNSKWIIFFSLWIIILLPFESVSQVSADFSANITSDCSPLIVKFTDLSTGPVTSWHWSFGNGNTSIQENPGAIYINPGSYDVTLIVSDGTNTDTIVKNNFITVFTDPAPNFTANKTQGCVPLSVQFTDLSIPGSSGIVSWSWDFGEGTVSLNQNPSHTFTLPGTYDITLLVLDGNGCEGELVMDDYIVVGDIPSAAFSSGPNSACFPPLTVNFTNQSTSLSPLTYIWDFGDLNTSTAVDPSHEYTLFGGYTVTLIASSDLGCKDTTSLINHIIVQDLSTDFQANKVTGCVDDPIQFSDMTTPTPYFWDWDFGDGNTSTLQNPTHTYSSPGTYSVMLVTSDSSSCIDNIIKPGYITIHTAPTADFTQDQVSSCSLPFTVNFSDISSDAVTWYWEFGDSTFSTLQNPSHTYTHFDSFDVSLTVMNSDSCYHTLPVVDLIKITPPRANFDADDRRGCVPIDADFEDQSESVEPIVSWFWDFGDSTTSSAQNPSHTYSDPGNYHVTLIIENISGCIDTLIDSSFIEAGITPTAEFSANPTVACLYDPVAFLDNSIGDNEWYWDFGDGGNSDMENPTYTYADTGTFSVLLIARDNGCPDTIVKENYVTISPPDAIFTIDQDCENPYDVIFNDNSLGPDTWLWDFGDGNTDTTQSPTHTYSATGVYALSLLVTNISSGCFDDETSTVTITDAQAAFAASTLSGCAPLSVVFLDTSQDAISWSWASGGMTSSSPNPTFVYQDPGYYDVSLIITDANGCSDTLNKPQYITVLGPTPEFGASPLTGCAPLQVNYSDSSTSFLGTVNSWDWDFGDGNTSNLQHPVHTYNVTGAFSITLEVTDDNGCQKTISKNDFIQPTYPNPMFSADTLSCTSKSVSFVNSSAGTGLNFLWDFGDGNTSTDVDPIHAYDLEGIYTITLTAQDVNGCDSTVVKTNYVTVSDPIAEFGSDTSFSPCPPLLVNFLDSSTVDAVAWEWDLGDGTISNFQNPTHMYTAPGKYDVRLITTNLVGCKDTIFKPEYIVVLGPNGIFDFNPKDVCLGETVSFTATTYNTVVRTWDFGDGTLLVAGDTIIYLYATPGIHYPSLILDDGLGCIFPIASSDSVIVGDLDVDFVASTHYHCKQGPVLFGDLSTGFPTVNSWSWDFGDGGSSNAKNVTYNYQSPSSYDVTLIASNQICTDTLTKTNLIGIDPGPASAIGTNSLQGCIPLTINFQDLTISDSTIISWAWDFGDGEIDSVPDPVHVFDSAGTFNTRMIVTSSSGCPDTSIVIITAHDLPVISAGNDTSICFKDSLQMTALGANTYIWSPSTGLDNPIMGNTLASPPSEQQYILTGYDINGCSDRDTVIISVKSLPIPAASEDVAICEGSGIQIWAAGGTGYEWNPQSGLSCGNCDTVIASPAATTPYIVKVIDSNACFDFDTVNVTILDIPEGILTNDTTICDGQTVSIISDGGINYDWSPSTGLSCDDCQNPLASPSVSTTYYLSVFNQPICERFDSITITVNPVPVIQLNGDSLICEGDTTTLNASGGSQYQWLPSTGLSCSNCPDPGASPIQSTIYQLEVSNQYNCSSFDSFTIMVNPLPIIETIDDVTICAGDNIELTTGYTYASDFSWSPINTLDSAGSESPVANPGMSTTYTIQAVSPYGCSREEHIVISVIDEVVVATEDATICQDESTLLDAQVLQSGHLGTNYIWFPVNNITDPTTLNPVADPDHSITYTLIAFSGSCKPDTQDVAVTVNELPAVEIKEVGTLVEGTDVQFELESTGIIDQYEWFSNHDISCRDCENPFAYITQTGEYKVMVTDINGCISQDSILVKVSGKCGEDIYVPNTFTPNGDRQNDELFVRGLGIIGVNHFRVFDRWGKLVFDGKEINHGWDGNYKYERLSPGVYVFELEAVCTNGKLARKKGNVTLIR